MMDMAPSRVDGYLGKAARERRGEFPPRHSRHYSACSNQLRLDVSVREGGCLPRPKRQYREETQDHLAGNARRAMDGRRHVPASEQQRDARREPCSSTTKRHSCGIADLRPKRTVSDARAALDANRLLRCGLQRAVQRRRSAALPHENVDHVTALTCLRCPRSTIVTSKAPTTRPPATTRRATSVRPVSSFRYPIM